MSRALVAGMESGSTIEGAPNRRSQAGRCAVGSGPTLVPSLIETTRHIEPKRAFEFWRCTALAPFGDIGQRHPRERFSAKRLSVASADWSLTHTVSSPVEVEFRSRHVDRNAAAMVVIGLAVDGLGYQEQDGRGAQINAGDINFLSLNRPFVAGTLSAYEEIRLAVPRATFEAWIGRADAFAGRSLTRDPAGAEFRACLRSVAGSIAWMSADEAQAAVEGALHLLGRLAGGATEEPRRELSQAAVGSLARAHIARRMRDPNLGPGEIHAALGISRSSLYRTFAESGGIATAIRDARLDLARRRLAAPQDSKLKIATIAYACGFTDIPTFNRGFRRRFGLSPGDLRP
ncbi:helix-turn-helix domain-containing protein [Methylobacterium sp. J-070]|uniref:helix-turn-helix domain-containing protein n=1 Tax=Methylobacterium sp. J-070 TaxID=2836650 RepID=UPI001FBB9112|nr:helix-turn-helix domain-containing protein [Methylobacterium sp. J-070]MCJ2050389.1 helix-turn-helix domain-containing protein [Methylobacterium sp. J-070]